MANTRKGPVQRGVSLSLEDSELCVLFKKKQIVARLELLVAAIECQPYNGWRTVTRPRTCDGACHGDLKHAGVLELTLAVAACIRSHKGPARMLAAIAVESSASMSTVSRILNDKVHERNERWSIHLGPSTKQ
jgi:hypothetical protein